MPQIKGVIDRVDSSFVSITVYQEREFLNRIGYNTYHTETYNLEASYLTKKIRIKYKQVVSDILYTHTNWVCSFTISEGRIVSVRPIEPYQALYDRWDQDSATYGKEKGDLDGR